MAKLAIVFLFGSICGWSTQENVKVSIYYEALCGDSIRFISQQFDPNYEQVATRITVDFVPYGFATQEIANGTWAFQCQHGPNECYGNLMQACGLAETNDQATQVKFVDCVMSARSPAADASIQECAKASGISWNNMVNCSQDGVGNELLAGLGNRTHAVKPTITWVPTVIYNDVYNAELQASSMTDFLGTVCKLIGDDFCK